jgi:hypothetical protein
MIQRFIVITIMQIALYIVGIPFLIAYQISCQRLGASCPFTPTAETIQEQPSRAMSTARLPR